MKLHGYFGKFQLFSQVYRADLTLAIFGRPLGQAYAIGNPSVCPSVRPSVCNVGVLWPNGLSDRDDFWHTPCPGQQ